LAHVIEGRQSALFGFYSQDVMVLQQNDRLGCHDLVIGQGYRFSRGLRRRYDGYGQITHSKRSIVVLGGSNGTAVASGVVAGGYSNHASTATVLDGYINQANGTYSTIVVGTRPYIRLLTR
jgi:hypothetical protein